MISEGSCDTEDWSNDAENVSSFVIPGINVHFKILQYYCFTVFWLNKSVAYDCV